MIYASSIHAISGYPKDTQVKTIDPVNPGDLYGKENLSTVSINENRSMIRCNEVFW